MEILYRDTCLFLSAFYVVLFLPPVPKMIYRASSRAQLLDDLLTVYTVCDITL